MASLKEIKERIQSVRSTRKITSAMKMVAAAKLHRTQREAAALVPYSEELQGIVAHLVAGEGVGHIALAEEREVERVTIVGFASNSTLCGAYNANVGREVVAVRRGYTLPDESVRVVAMGKRLAVELKKGGVAFEEGDCELSEKPNYANLRVVAEEFMRDFIEGRTDRVELVYYKFLSAGNQQLVCERLLPIELPAKRVGEWNSEVPYILEPSRRELVESIIPREVALKLYTAALSALASEHAARMIAMQATTDNADDLIGELSVEYNKQRQQAITTELLDIMGGQNG